MTQETSKAIAVPNSALLCEQLLSQYGEESYFGSTSQQARFEVEDTDGSGVKVLLTQKGIGAGATFKIYLDDVRERGYESVYTTQPGSSVTQQIKSRGEIIAGPYEWPESTASSLLYDCFGRRVY